ncbi:uncharacterized protein LOC116584414 [Mustela erminea]|uniref:uncharacterized protein LOC116584414 n=1 Tax=Mustela erminea TaxID=36723 RepID=UPI00138732D4|nr:uncharacterized protein LOC116584414 [Mustela erminea]
MIDQPWDPKRPLEGPQGQVQLRCVLPDGAGPSAPRGATRRGAAARRPPGTRAAGSWRCSALPRTSAARRARAPHCAAHSSRPASQVTPSVILWACAAPQPPFPSTNPSLCSPLLSFAVRSSWSRGSPNWPGKSRRRKRLWGAHPASDEGAAVPGAARARGDLGLAGGRCRGAEVGSWTRGEPQKNATQLCQGQTLGTLARGWSAGRWCSSNWADAVLPREDLSQGYNQDGG